MEVEIKRLKAIVSTNNEKIRSETHAQELKKSNLKSLKARKDVIVEQVQKFLAQLNPSDIDVSGRTDGTDRALTECHPRTNLHHYTL